MRKLVTSAALSLVLAIGGLAPSFAAPLSAPVAPEVKAASDVQQVRHRRGFYRDRGHYYYNGHRGYRHRPSARYRSYNGLWFPFAAFALGSGVGFGAGFGYNNYGYAPRTVYRQPRVIYREPRVVYRGALPRAHYRWCYDRYRSYRASDNTFQPYHGPRRACYSPYD